MEDPEKEIEFQGVYRYDASGDLHIMDAELSRPNGIAFSPDEKILYVANSDPERAIWMAYDIDKESGILSKKIFYDVTELTSSEKGLPDGLKVNDAGYLFATGPGGVPRLDARRPARGIPRGDRAPGRHRARGGRR